MACWRDPLTNVCVTGNGHVGNLWGREGGGGCSPRPEQREWTSWSDPGRQAEKVADGL